MRDYIVVRLDGSQSFVAELATDELTHLRDQIRSGALTNQGYNGCSLEDMLERLDIELTARSIAT